MSTLINKIIDSNAAYAYTFLTRAYGYGHMTLEIKLQGPEYGFRKSGKIRVTCQIGGEGTDQSSKTYAWAWGLATDCDSIEIEELDVALKMMKKIKRYMDKQEFDNGYPDSYAEFCQRILLGSGVGPLIAESRDGWANGGRMDEKQLINSGAASMRKLREMESTLINQFSRLAA